ncbi:hypothetical protein SAMN02745194_00335 [Roseomonas rosea]|uniref:Uncharacterized protein n=1 Tax=Muricoccus roseus TaxID=198092 RepID=A0A1M6B313_9PROT|nr:hypothetical protein [Roseomonas rosea]SHI42853.1 hypothetical protein SAMN02745194_00335 [Roseomonas rosea]
MHRSASFALLTLLAACGYGDSRMAHEAQLSMEGMTAADLQACAGIPEKTKRLDARTELFSYSVKNEAAGGVEVSLPVIGGGYTLGGSGTACTATFRLVDDRVSGLFYSGNNDRPIGRDGVCAHIIRGCMRRPLSSMTRTDDTASASSAFRQPPAPPPPSQPAVVRMEPIGR